MGAMQTKRLGRAGQGAAAVQYLQQQQPLPPSTFFCYLFFLLGENEQQRLSHGISPLLSFFNTTM
jgi:hypothetical protein